MTRARRKPSLPPLFRWQIDTYFDGVMLTEAYKTMQELRGCCPLPCEPPIIIRSLRTGSIYWRNKAAKEAGY